MYRVLLTFCDIPYSSNEHTDVRTMPHPLNANCMEYRRTMQKRRTSRSIHKRAANKSELDPNPEMFEN